MSRITTTVVTLLLTTAAFGQAKDDAGEGKKLDKQTMEIKDYLPEIHGTIRGKYLRYAMPVSVFREMYIRWLLIRQKSTFPMKALSKCLMRTHVSFR